MSLKDYLAAKLEADGYDGLAGHGCGCDTDDLAACGEDCLHCEPGHRVACTAEESNDAPCGCYEECISPGVGQWCMRPGRRPLLDDGEPRQPCGHDRDADCRCTS